MCWGWMEFFFFLTPSRGLQKTQDGTDWCPWTWRASRCPGSHIHCAQRHLTMPVGSQEAWDPTCEDKVHRAPESLGSAAEIKQALSVVKQQHTFAVCLKLSRPPIKYPHVISHQIKNFLGAAVVSSVQNPYIKKFYRAAVSFLFSVQLERITCCLIMCFGE